MLESLLASLFLIAMRWDSCTNLVIVVLTNLGSEAGLICKPQLRPGTKPRCCEAVSRNPINKAFTYDGFPRFQTVDLSPQFCKGNFDAVCSCIRGFELYTFSP